MNGDLLTELRENDLPPFWDGHAVVWEGWEYAQSGVFICPTPKREVCEGCGKPTMERGFPCWSVNKGMVADSPSLPHDDFHRENAARDRLPVRVKGKMPRRWWLNLYAWRCHHCQLDTVWDVNTGEMWTLDHTDYGPEGSR